MWINITTDERDLITATLRQLTIPEAVSLIEQLNREPDSDTEAFANAVETSDDLEVDSDVVISRGDKGAFVMSWSWVTNEEAGIEEHQACERCGEEHPVGVLDADLCPACAELACQEDDEDAD